jgi:hypothetical protein
MNMRPSLRHAHVNKVFECGAMTPYSSIMGKCGCSSADYGTQVRCDRFKYTHPIRIDCRALVKQV